MIALIEERGTNADGCGCDISLRRSQVGAPIFINVNVCKSMLLDLPADVDLGAIIGSMQTLFRAIDTIRTERRRTSQVTQRALGKPSALMMERIAGASGASSAGANRSSSEYSVRPPGALSLLFIWNLF